MKRTLFALALVFALALAPVSPVYAAGSVVVTEFDAVNGVVKYSIAWTSDASGNVNSNAVRVKSGKVIQTQFIPGSGGTAPTALYDVTLLDPKSIDVLQAGGADLSATVTRIAIFLPAVLQDDATLQLVVANAGNAKTGTVNVWVQR